MKKTDRTRWLEISAVVITGLMKYVFTDWLELRVFYIGSACLFWTLYIYKRHRRDKLILQKWGFRKEHFKQSFLFLLPFSLAIIAAIAWYGISFNAIFLNWHVIPIILFYPVWGIIQQFLMTALVAGNLWSISGVKLNNPQIIILTSALFAVVHYPSVLLMAFTFFMELLFTSAYFRWRNLWPIGLFHGWVASLLLFFVLDRDLWSELWIVF
ncbi:CPBP family glutamic-type intramembrane protease [Prolixibacteraceae bacterium Z1-6]|uniref:CPBP family glutamic-type intramembrane protease n=1 Tax=Draconibacterium aestuarii TaxID=2998507 RepID=A0A9X3FH94_9BACT|nr:CPBP family glutamic-type intramembrane protease [Prolixibacteraceae bacterium Z1-6]